jgi:hypothetical protein
MVDLAGMVFPWNRGKARFTEASTLEASTREAGVQAGQGYTPART